MRLDGTSFQKLVWSELLSIPIGEVRTYKQIAEAIGRPRSYRAVANACGANPYAPEIPCHRAIRSDGRIGGYSAKGGLSRKLELCLLYTSPSPRDLSTSRMPSSA